MYIEESQVLRRFYPEITYDYTELKDVPQYEFHSAFREASQGKIVDANILNRISLLAASASRSSFFYAPNNNLLYVISINRQGTVYLIRVSIFTVNNRLPGGSFATSAGSWNLVRAGNPANPSVHEILKIFPTLK